MIDLSVVAKRVKNQISDQGCWFVCMSVNNKDNSINFDIVANTDDVTWNGKAFTAFPFSMEEINESTRGEFPNFTISVSNVERVVQSYIEQDSSHGSGWDVYLDMVHSSYLSSSQAEVSYHFKTLSVLTNEKVVAFNVGKPNPLRLQFPRIKMLPDYCQHTFKQGGCTYVGSDTICGKKLSDCRAKFVGQRRVPALLCPGIPTGAIYV